MILPDFDHDSSSYLDFLVHQIRLSDAASRKERKKNNRYRIDAE
jgi:hypothetical protein